MKKYRPFILILSLVLILSLKAISQDSVRIKIDLIEVGIANVSPQGDEEWRWGIGLDQDDEEDLENTIFNETYPIILSKQDYMVYFGIDAGRGPLNASNQPPLGDAQLPYTLVDGNYEYVDSDHTQNFYFDAVGFQKQKWYGGALGDEDFMMLWDVDPIGSSSDNYISYNDQALLSFKHRDILPGSYGTKTINVYEHDSGYPWFYFTLRYYWVPVLSTPEVDGVSEGNSAKICAGNDYTVKTSFSDIVYDRPVVTSTSRWECDDHGNTTSYASQAACEAVCTHCEEVVTTSTSTVVDTIFPTIHWYRVENYIPPVANCISSHYENGNLLHYECVFGGETVTDCSECEQNKCIPVFERVEVCDEWENITPPYSRIYGSTDTTIVQQTNRNTEITDNIRYNYMARFIGSQVSYDSDMSQTVFMYGRPPTFSVPDQTNSGEFIYNIPELTADSNTDADIVHASVYQGIGSINIKNVDAPSGAIAKIYIRDIDDDMVVKEGLFDMNTIEPLTGLSAGMYEMKIENRYVETGQDGCYDSCYFEIRQPKPVQATIQMHEYPGGKNLRCHDSEDGQISVTPTGGLGNYTIRLEGEGYKSDAFESYEVPNAGKDVEQPFANLSKYSGADSLMYTVLVRDEFDTSWFERDVEFLPDTTNIDDPDYKEGSILNLLSPDTLEILNINKSMYTDGEGKFGGDSTYNIQCFGGTDQVSILTKGGSLTRWIKVNNDSVSTTVDTQGTFTGLAHGTYTIFVTDTNGCTTQYTDTLIQAPEIKMTYDTPLPDCYGQSTQVSLYGESGYKSGYFDYDITEIVPPQDEVHIDSLRNVGNKSNSSPLELTAGDYILEITSDKGCTKTDTFTVSNPAPFTVSFDMGHVACKGDSTGSVLATLHNGKAPYYTRFFRRIDNSFYKDTTLQAGDSTVFYPKLPVGDYEFSAYDFNSCDCILDTLIKINGPEHPLELNIANIKHISCFGAEDANVRLSPNNGWGINYLYATSPDKTGIQIGSDWNFTLPDSGSYTFYVADKVNDSTYCFESVSVDIEEPPVLQAEIISSSDLSCYQAQNGQVTFNIKGGRTPYSIWVENISSGTNHTIVVPDEGMAMVDSLEVGVYNFTITDSSGCSVNDAQIIKQPDLLEIKAIDKTQPLCGQANGEFVAHVSGGTTEYSFEWSNSTGVVGNGSILSNISSGAYSLLVTDASGCKVSTDITLSDADGPEVSEIITIPALCSYSSDGEAELIISEGLELIDSIVWMGTNVQDTTRIDILPQGNHEVMVLDNNNCRAYYPFVIDAPEAITIHETQVSHPVCMGDENGVIEVQANGGSGTLQYEWLSPETASSRIENLLAGDYEVRVSDANNCQATHVVSLFNPEPVLVDLGGDKTICGGQSVPLSPQGYATYEWKHNDNIISTGPSVDLHEAGTYEITVTNEVGCEATDAFELIVSNSVLDAEFIMSSETHVNDTIIIVDVSWPIPDSIRWEFDSGILVQDITDNYAELMFESPGMYYVTLYAAMGNCRDMATQSILVLDENEEHSFKQKKESLIKSFTAYPNPNSGIFYTKTELSREAEVRIRIYNLHARSILYERSGTNNDIYEFNYNLPELLPGIYVIALEVENETRTIRIVIL